MGGRVVVGSVRRGAAVAPGRMVRAYSAAWSDEDVRRWRDQVLRGRCSECGTLDGLLEAVRAGESRALVLRGEPGVGKTFLLEYLAGRASGFRTVRVIGVQSEMELPFAGLHQLCAPMLDLAERLPGPQRDALRTTLGLSAGPTPDRFLVGLAALGLLAEAARDRPLLCILDDAQWLDHASAQALAFVARRLRAESVAMVFAARAPDGAVELADLPELAVEGLPDDEARALLGSRLRGPVDERVLQRIVAETRGNPLALLELPRGLTPAELAAGFGPAGARALPQQIEDSFQRQLEPLDAETRQLLLVAAAEPVGDPVLVWRAVERLGIGAATASPAASDGLVEIGTVVRFRHPLVRSAIYRAASPEERRTAHRALADATDPTTDPDRRAWHCAGATPGPDEDVADELERSADRAQARGGLAAAAAFLERAAELTPDPARRAERTLAAAQTTHHAGMPDAALRLLSIAEAAPLDKLQRAQTDLLRARIALTLNRGREAPPLLLNAAKQLEPLDTRLARETYLDALLAVMFAGGAVQEAAEAARAAPPPAQPPRAADLLLDGLAIRFTEGYAAGLPMLRNALCAFRSPDLSEEELHWLWLAHITAGNLWDEETHDTGRHVRLACDSGALSTLPLALTSRIGAFVHQGELGEAGALLEEVEAVSAATGIPVAPYGALLLSAWQGREAQAAALIESTTAEMLRRGEGFGLIITGYADALLGNSVGRYEDALAAAVRAGAHPPVMGVEPWLVLVELIEAATRSGQPDRAAGTLARLVETTGVSGTDWALGIEARCRALLADAGTAEGAYREAIARLGRTRVRGELARAHLLYGEWLRRERRRLDARAELRTAHEMFTAMDMQAFARRAARELLATGATARKRSTETSSDLTAQETQVVRLVRDGLSNPEIAARLFISPRTVEYHLHKIFGKLNITSRRQLYR
ncbi:helix-turn-helix transcriptional regulator [Pseudonocardia xinjiangensis]|uniref:helix-turn-helix transcriptional regulator n=1 Tax=Pseudonocardia xinjiangensis TaxID=75289 RepID=UPI003D8BF13D